jgi:hypothetical protein
MLTSDSRRLERAEMLTSGGASRSVLKPRHWHFVEHLLVGAAIRTLLGQLALDAIAAVRTGPVDGLGLAPWLLRIVGQY